MKTQCDVIVVGGGASGLLCAVMLARKGVQVTVLEKNHRIGKKDRKSTRLNSSHRCTSRMPSSA